MKKVPPCTPFKNFHTKRHNKGIAYLLSLCCVLVVDIFCFVSKELSQKSGSRWPLISCDSQSEVYPRADCPLAH